MDYVVAYAITAAGVMCVVMQGSGNKIADAVTMGLAWPITAAISLVVFCINAYRGD